MNISPLTSTDAYRPELAGASRQAGAIDEAKKQGSPELREKFDSFVGETFFSQMLSSMRKTVEKPAYFHGGRAEEVFQGQLDQMLSQEMTKASAGQFSGPMFDLFMLSRS